MNPSAPGQRRRARQSTIAASIILAAWMLASCSSSGESAADMAGAPAFEAQDEGYSMAEESWEGDVGEDGADRAALSTVTSERSVIVTGELFITVEDPITAAQQATIKVQAAGGRIDGRSETAPHESHGGSAWLTLRIPTAKLDDVVNELRDLGTVDEYRTDSIDVTTEVTDLEARVSTLRASTDRIEGLLHEARDISDIIKLESELAERQATLEGLEARQRGLNDQVSMSTIQLSLTTEPVVIIEDDPSSFWDGLVAGWNGLMGFLSVALVVIGVLLPWLALIALITFAVIFVVRRGSARTARRRAATSQAAHALPTESAPAAQPATTEPGSPDPAFTAPTANSDS